MTEDLKDNTILIAGQNNVPEIFYTLEGEGRLIGYPSVFMRLSMCNLTCIGFKSVDSPNGCDSYVSWSIKNKLTFEQLAELLEKEGYKELLLEKNVIWKITGGEPLVQQKTLIKFFKYVFKRWNCSPPDIDFETNGTITPDPELMETTWASFTVSPKLFNNGDPEHKRYIKSTLAWHVNNASCFKFVVQNEKDIEEIFAKYVNEPDIKLPLELIWFMPCCGSQKELLENGPKVAEWAKKYGVKFSNRMHLQIWDKALRV
jgi:7-carboxy-7-deazaguanine synthase